MDNVVNNVERRWCQQTLCCSNQSVLTGGQLVANRWVWASEQIGWFYQWKPARDEKLGVLLNQRRRR